MWQASLVECRCWRERVSLGDQNASWQTPVGEILRFQITAQIKSTNSSVVGACICSRWQGRAMGLRERFLTAGVAVPLALWAILYDARLCLSLVLVLQAICVQELHELLRRTRSGFVVPRFNRAPSSWATVSPVRVAVKQTSLFVAAPTMTPWIARRILQRRSPYLRRAPAVSHLASTIRICRISALGTYECFSSKWCAVLYCTGRKPPRTGEGRSSMNILGG